MWRCKATIRGSSFGQNRLSVTPQIRVPALNHLESLKEGGGDA
jgi:hypothetical protein